MDIEFGTTELRRLATEPGYTAGYPPEVETMYRRRIQFIDAAPNDLALRNQRSWRFKKLKGDRSEQHSIRLNDQWRLVVELRTGGERRIVRIVSIEDYH